MPRPKRPAVVTVAAPRTGAAIDELKTGIEHFLEWANRARTGQTASPSAQQLDAALTAFSEGRGFKSSDLDVWAVAAGANIRSLIRGGHWHLRTCPFCTRWVRRGAILVLVAG